MTPEQAAEIAAYRAANGQMFNPDAPGLAPFECVWVEVMQVHDETCYVWPNSEMFKGRDACALGRFLADAKLAAANEWFVRFLEGGRFMEAFARDWQRRELARLFPYEPTLDTRKCDAVKKL